MARDKITVKIPFLFWIVILLSICSAGVTVFVLSETGYDLTTLAKGAYWFPYGEFENGVPLTLLSIVLIACSIMFGVQAGYVFWLPLEVPLLSVSWVRTLRLRSFKNSMEPSKLEEKFLSLGFTKAGENGVDLFNKHYHFMWVNSILLSLCLGFFVLGAIKWVITECASAKPKSPQRQDNESGGSATYVSTVPLQTLPPARNNANKNDAPPPDYGADSTKLERELDAVDGMFTHRNPASEGTTTDGTLTALPPAYVARERGTNMEV